MTMEMVYLLSAIIGGTFLVLQTLLSLIGLGDHDLDMDDHDGFDPDQQHDFFKYLSLRTLVAFLTFFGLAGMAGQQADLGPVPTVLVAAAAGAASVFAVAHLFLALGRLQSEGNVDLQRAVGHEARVYLHIPGQDQGEGKITVAVQDRTVECAAVTSGPDIDTGCQVRVIEVLGARKVRVVPLEPSLHPPMEQEQTP